MNARIPGRGSENEASRIPRSRLRLLSIALTLVTVSAACQAGDLPTTQPGFHQVVTEVYSFSPHTLATEQLQAKSAVLDGFWTRVKNRPSAFIPLLRQELARADASPFFCYDGSMLLLDLSKSPEDRSLALSAVGRADLRDLQPTGYLLTVHSFAVDGLDTADAALKILGDPKFQAFIPVHSLTLGQDYALLYMLLPTDEGFYLPKLITRLGQETDPVAVKSLLRVLSYTVTSKGDEAVDQYAADRSHPEDLRKAAEDLRGSRTVKAIASLGGLVTGPVTYCSLKKARRLRLGSVSDEALIDLDVLTAGMRFSQPTLNPCS